jgi:hypothetical protein
MSVSGLNRVFRLVEAVGEPLVAAAGLAQRGLVEAARLLAGDERNAARAAAASNRVEAVQTALPSLAGIAPTGRWRASGRSGRRADLRTSRPPVSFARGPLLELPHPVLADERVVVAARLRDHSATALLRLDERPARPRRGRVAGDRDDEVREQVVVVGLVGRPCPCSSP